METTNRGYRDDIGIGRKVGESGNYDSGSRDWARFKGFCSKVLFASRFRG